MRQYFYVYRITIDNKYHYYGARSTNLLPSQDLGIKYFSSSIIVNEAIKKSKCVKYKIIKTFSTFEKALEFEIRLHRKFNVEEHSRFLNRRNQTSTKFIHSTLDKVAMYNPEDNRIQYVHKDKVNIFISLGYIKGIPEFFKNKRRNKPGTFLNKKHRDSTKNLLRAHRSMQIRVEFKDGSTVEFQNRLKLGEYLGMSPQLGARLVRESHRKDLWDKYNIKDIIRL